MFNLEIVCYLFLGGAGAGGILVLAVLCLLVPDAQLTSPGGSPTMMDIAPRRTPALLVSPAHRRLFLPAYSTALAALLLGVVFLISDLGRPDRLFLLVTNPQSSYIVVGTYAIACCAILGGALLSFWGGFMRVRSMAPLRILSVLAIATALVVMAYTGMFLASMKAIPLWNTLWLPVLFTLSSASCGCALVLASCELSGSADAFRSTCRRLVTVDTVLAMLEAGAMALLVADALDGAPLNLILGSDSTGLLAAALAPGGSISHLSASAKSSLTSIWELLSGEDAWVFWGGFAAVGLVAGPLLGALSTRGVHRTRPPLLASAACVLVGGFVMRLCLVEAGIHPLLIG